MSAQSLRSFDPAERSAEVRAIAKFREQQWDAPQTGGLKCSGDPALSRRVLSIDVPIQVRAFRAAHVALCTSSMNRAAAAERTRALLELMDEVKAGGTPIER